jgi:long-chain acyl-CoA synthetase
LEDATAAAFTEDGWLRTGDKGVLDPDGFLTITGRLKEMFKTSGGKYIVPPAIEAKFIAECPYVSQFLVFGEGRNFCVALIALDPDTISGWAAERGFAGKSYAELVKLPEVHALIDEHVKKLNSELNRWETIKKWTLLDHELSVERGELTPSLKVKRAVVGDRNKEVLDAFYA